MKTCHLKDCNKKAVYGNKQQKETTCTKHKNEGMVKRPLTYCRHNRKCSRCRQCGGSSICEHSKVRYQCKLCSGKGICEHGRIRSTCKPCGGGGSDNYSTHKANNDGLPNNYNSVSHFTLVRYISFAIITLIFHFQL